MLEQPWERSGLAGLVGELAEARNIEFPLKRALVALVAHRAASRASKRECHERWLAEELHIEGGDALELRHLCRAMDVLEEETGSDGVALLRESRRSMTWEGTRQPSPHR